MSAASYILNGVKNWQLLLLACKFSPMAFAELPWCPTKLVKVLTWGWGGGCGQSWNVDYQYSHFGECSRSVLVWRRKAPWKTRNCMLPRCWRTELGWVRVREPRVYTVGTGPLRWDCAQKHGKYSWSSPTILKYPTYSWPSPQWTYVALLDNCSCETAMMFKHFLVSLRQPNCKRYSFYRVTTQVLKQF